MLTLLLVLGAVTCSPVPSDLPAIPDAAHIEVTHEVRHVTFEVSEEVNEATASSHIPSNVPPEEDPPIPTVTTPHTVPEEQHPTDDAPKIDVASHPLEPAGEISQETPTEHDVTAAESLQEEVNSDEKKTEIESEEKEEILTQTESEEKEETLTEIESTEKEETLTESEISESENVSESERSQETDESLSSESVELVSESHVFFPNEDANDSLPEDTTEAASEVVPIDTSVVVTSDEEQALSVTPAEIVNSALSEPEHKKEEIIEAEQTPVAVSADPVEVETVSKVVGQTEVQKSADLIVEVHDPVSEVHHVGGGEVLEEVPSQILLEAANSEFLETEKRTDNENLPVHEDVVQEPVSESPEADVGIVVPEENVPETTRESRVYIEYEDKESTETEESEDEPTVPKEAAEQEKSSTESKSHPANDDLESMSMTSPTPESLPEEVPIVDDLEKEEAPPAEHQEETATVFPEVDSQEENSTLITDAEEPNVVPELVINPPSSSVAPLPIEEFTDNYSDPIHFGDLPDFDVTHEQLPSKDYPQPEEAELIPEQTHDHTGEASEGESSDLAAGDHMLEVEAGTPLVLPPQQEQVSAAAPSALTPGCIVAIVFGVLVSLVVILGVGGFMVWQRRTQNRPKVLGNDQGYAGSDSGGYIDDQGSPEDLISLDNDSFLNSLESMTIQNLWTDNIRHTKL